MPEQRLFVAVGCTKIHIVKIVIDGLSYGVCRACRDKLVSVDLGNDDAYVSLPFETCVCGGGVVFRIHGGELRDRTIDHVSVVVELFGPGEIIDRIQAQRPAPPRVLRYPSALRLRDRAFVIHGIREGEYLLFSVHLMNGQCPRVRFAVHDFIDNRDPTLGDVVAQKKRMKRQMRAKIHCAGEIHKSR